MIVRQLSNGDWMVFDSQAKTLYLVPAASAGKGKLDVAAAQQLVKAGQAKKFEKAELETLQSALSIVVLLG